MQLGRHRLPPGADARAIREGVALARLGVGGRSFRKHVATRLVGYLMGLVFCYWWRASRPTVSRAGSAALVGLAQYCPKLAYAPRAYSTPKQADLV